MAAVPVNFYVDGFNVYHALLRFRDPKVEWLDLAALCKRLILLKTERIQAIKYFSAYAHWLPDSMARHQQYVRALEATGVIAGWVISKIKIVNAKLATRSGSLTRKRKPTSALASLC